jgi:hypothetical protein
MTYSEAMTKISGDKKQIEEYLQNHRCENLKSYKKQIVSDNPE